MVHCGGLQRIVFATDPFHKAVVGDGVDRPDIRLVKLPTDTPRLVLKVEFGGVPQLFVNFAPFALQFFHFDEFISEEAKGIFTGDGGSALAVQQADVKFFRYLPCFKAARFLGRADYVLPAIGQANTGVPIG